MSIERRHDSTLRDGFSLVELIVAVILLGAVLVTLGGLSFRAAQTSLSVANSSGRQAVMSGLVNRLMSMDYDSLPAAGTTGCDTIVFGANDYRRCVVTNDSTGFLHFELTVTPLDTMLAEFPTTQRLTRSPATSPNPLAP